MNMNYSVSYGVGFKGVLLSSAALSFLLFSQGESLAADPSPNGEVGVTTVEVNSNTLKEQELDRVKLQSIPGSTDFITADDVATKNQQSFSSILVDQPGVILGQTGGNTAPKITIRGSGLTFSPGNMQGGVKFLFNGLPLSGPEGFSYELLQPQGVNHTEVLLGANGLQYGAVSLGGAINAVDETGLTQPGSVLHAEAGSFGYVKESGSYGGVFGDTNVYINASNQRSSGYQKLTDERSKNLSFNVGHEISSNLETQFFFKFAHEFHYNATPVSLLQINSYPNRLSSNPNALNYPSSAAKYASAWIGSKTTYHFDDGGSLEFGQTYSRLPQYLNTMSPSTIAQNTNTPGQSMYSNIGSSLQYNNTFWGFGVKDKFKASAYYSDEIFGSTVAYGEISAANPSLQLLKKTRYTGSYDLVISQQNDFELTPDWHLIVDGSAIQVNRSIGVTSTYTPNTTSYPSSFSYNTWDFAPRLGATYQVTKEVQLYSNLSRSVDSPVTWMYLPSSYSSYKNFVRPLKNQTANSGEIGSRYTQGGVEGSINFFYSRIRDELLANTTYPNGTNNAAVTANLNSTPTLHEGVEVGAKIPVWESSYGDKLSVHPTLTYSDFHYQHDLTYGTNQLPLVPTYLYTAAVDYQFKDGYYIGGNAHVSSAVQVDYANTLRAPHYTIFGAKAGFIDPENRFSTTLEFQNLSNEKYVTIVNPTTNASGKDGNYFYPGDGFAVYAGLTAYF